MTRRELLTAAGLGALTFGASALLPRADGGPVPLADGSVLIDALA